MREHLTSVGVHSLDLVHEDLDVAVIAENRAHGYGDVGRRKTGRGHLVKQRLEQMVIAPVDHGYPDRCALQPSGRFEPAEAGADDDDMGMIKHRVWTVSMLSQLPHGSIEPRSAVALGAACWLQPKVTDVTIFSRLEMGGAAVRTTFDIGKGIIGAMLVLALD